MIHIYNQGKEGAPVFILLHGTGGDETNLIPVANRLNQDYGVLSVRGNVSEYGANRYFKRLAEGQYDLEDLEERGAELLEFIKDSGKEYGFDPADAVLLGFSNGANIAINLLLREEAPFKKAFLFSPLYPVDVSDNQKDLSGAKIFTSMGRQDPMATEEDNKHVISIFEDRKADVEVYWGRGHELNAEILRSAREWLEKNN